VKNFVFVGQPNSLRSKFFNKKIQSFLEIKISTNAIDYEIPSNKEFYNKTYAQQVSKNKMIVGSVGTNL
jgi:hypothetical protein